MSCLGAPACGVDVRVVSIDPEVIVVTPAIKVELGKKGPWGSSVVLGAWLSQEVLWAPRCSLCSKILEMNIGAIYTVTVLSHVFLSPLSPCVGQGLLGPFYR